MKFKDIDKIKVAISETEISIFEILEQESLWNGHVKIIGYQFVTKFKLVFCAKYDRAIRGLDLGFCEILKPLKWTNITSFFLIWLKRSTNFYYFSVNLNKILCFIYITGTCFW